MAHGGKRAGAGRPRTPIDENRMLARRAQGDSHRKIADSFGVSVHVITKALARLRRQRLPAVTQNPDSLQKDDDHGV